MTPKDSMNAVWKAYLLVITTLVLIALSYYYWQFRQASRTFAGHVREHVEMVTLAIRMNADRALLSQTVMEEVLSTFLGNSARFVAFLDAIEAFSDTELAAFAKEAGLRGIRIERKEDFSEGPSGWYPPRPDTGCPEEEFLHLEQQKLYLMNLPSAEGGSCIRVGLEDQRLAALGYRIGLETLMEGLSGLSGIRYARMEPAPRAATGDKMIAVPSSPEIRFEGEGEARIAHARMPLGDQTLLLGIAAGPFSRRIRQLQQEFWAFTAVILGLGGLFSWLLKRFHQHHSQQALRYEQELAAEREHAALGRASAAITHEIRNPLNAISMGIQRLRLEASGLQAKDHALLDAMGEAVRRTDAIVAELRRYARPLAPRITETDLSLLLKSSLDLYTPLFSQKKIRITTALPPACRVNADGDLMLEVFENLIKNAIEAQPDGGELHMEIEGEEAEARVRFENPGLVLPPEEIGKLSEPYFTTKTHGSGLGLSIAVRILRAHGGLLTLSSPRPGWLRVSLRLPLSAPDPPATTPNPLLR